MDNRGLRLRLTARLTALVMFVLLSTAVAGHPVDPVPGRTRLLGVRTGPHSVGFLVQSGVDRTRRISTAHLGTKIGMAVWYPSAAGAAAATISYLDYRLLPFERPLAPQERDGFARKEADAAVGSRHLGIVPLTQEQALESLSTRGLAIRDAPPLPSRSPVVMVLGGPYYLSSTAEALASHGFVVVAPFRFADQPNAVGAEGFTWYLENSVRDAEWVMNALDGIPMADPSNVSAIGHGGGGLQALLFAMRNVNVAAVVNIDSGNFSSRTEARLMPFYSPKLARVPYLFLATAATRKSQDLFDDFLAMHTSERLEVLLENPAVRHHDLSDIGRGVTALGLRGADANAIEQAYADVQELTMRFLSAHGRGGNADRSSVAGWLEQHSGPGRYTAITHPRRAAD